MGKLIQGKKWEIHFMNKGKYEAVEMPFPDKPSKDLAAIWIKHRLISATSPKGSSTTIQQLRAMGIEIIEIKEAAPTSSTS
jgi:hypothetical protein